MAEIVPFRGILYRAKQEAASLLAPPYDVLSPADRARYAAGHPKNVVQLILPEGEGDAKYAHAASLWRSWLLEGTLERAPEPALYRYDQTFTAEGQTHTRKGFIALLRLERFGQGSVKPHERTLSGPKVDRLKLMRACRAHFSQIFLLYSDRASTTDKLFEPAEAHRPLIACTTPDGVQQRLWSVTDRSVITGVSAFLRDQNVYIADGHHRYETMVALRDELRTQHPKAAADPRSPIHFGCVFLSNMEHEGLIVLPTHRVVHSVPGFDPETLLTQLSAEFVVDARPQSDAAAVRGILAEKGTQGPTFALALPGRSALYYLTLRSDVDPKLPGPAVLRTLDVTILHTLVLERILGITREAQAQQTSLRYVKDTAEALVVGREGKDGAQAVFLMNPTSPATVRAVADEGEVMPQKSTFFVPKIASGIVMNTIEPEEQVWMG